MDENDVKLRAELKNTKNRGVREGQDRYYCQCKNAELKAKVVKLLSDDVEEIKQQTRDISPAEEVDNSAPNGSVRFGS